MGHISSGELAAIALILSVTAVKLLLIGAVVYFAVRLALRSRRSS